MFNQSALGPSNNQKINLNSTVNTNPPNTSSNPTNSNLKQASNSSSYMMPPPPAPYIDPTYMFYAQMAAAAAANPFGYSPFMPPTAPFMNMMGQTRVPTIADDQQSIQSFHFDDTRSERKLNFMPMNTMPSVYQMRAQSIAGDTFTMPKQQQQQQTQIQQQQQTNSGLLIEDQKNEVQEVVSVKRESNENRMTPPMHPLPHVRACFSLNGIVKIRANDPCEGQPALVDIINLSDFMEHYLNDLKNKSSISNTTNNKLEEEFTDSEDSMDEEARNEILQNYKLLQEFPGPLLKENHTFKAQVIQFCLKM